MRVAQRKKIAVLSNTIKRDHPVQHFICGVHRQGGVQKSGEELHSKTYQSPTVPQGIVLKPNLHYGRQDTTSFDSRTSFDHSSKHKKMLVVERTTKVVAVK